MEFTCHVCNIKMNALTKDNSAGFKFPGGKVQYVLECGSCKFWQGSNVMLPDNENEFSVYSELFVRYRGVKMIERVKAVIERELNK